MPWFKVDDHLHGHQKARAAGIRAMGLWVLAGSWCAANLTDGYIPESEALHYGDRRDINRLVTVGLWKPEHRGEEPGYLFHDWLDFQPSRTETLEQRAYAAERMRNLRRRRQRPQAVDTNNRSPERSRERSPEHS